jgi:hypothetical protein
MFGGTDDSLKNEIPITPGQWRVISLHARVNNMRVKDWLIAVANNGYHPPGDPEHIALRKLTEEEMKSVTDEFAESQNSDFQQELSELLENLPKVDDE